MNLTKALLATICAGVLSLVVAVSAHHAYAQDADDANENLGTWSAPGSDSAEQSTHKVKTHPLSLKGCWSGSVMDAADGAGTATFQFYQSSNRKKIFNGSIIHFRWPDTAKATVPMSGAVTPSKFTFKGNAGRGCPIVTGSGTGDNAMLTGTVEFTGGCEMFFQDVTFSITPGCP